MHVPRTRGFADMRNALFAIVALGLGVALGARHAGAADEDNYRGMIAAQQKQLEEFAKRLDPFPGLAKVQDLVRATVRGGKLAVDSPLFARADLQGVRGKQFKAEIEGLPGFNRVMLSPTG